MVIGAALLWLLLPERFAVNVPIALLGWGNAPPSVATVQDRLRLPAHPELGCFLLYAR